MRQRRGIRTWRDRDWTRERAVSVGTTVVSSEDEKSTIKNPNDSWQNGDFLTFFPSERVGSLPSKKNSLAIGAGQRLVGQEFVEVAKGDDAPLEFDEETEDSLSKAELLKLQIVSALSLKIGTEIIIDSKGLVNGKKVGKGHRAYFGTLSTDKAPVDYLIPKVERGIGTVHCVIQYDTKKNCYQIKDLGNGCGTFIKIAGKITLKTGHAIFFGEIHFRITITEEELALRFLGGPRANHQL